MQRQFGFNEYGEPGERMKGLENVGRAEDKGNFVVIRQCRL